MQALLDRALAASQTPALVFLLYLTPVTIAVAALSSARKSVPGAAIIAAGGLAYCAWLLVPLRFALPEARQLSQYASILGWLWLVAAWAHHVLTEWPVPMWGHWLAGTVLCVLPFAFAIALLTP